jgi:hypothetical protein
MMISWGRGKRRRTLLLAIVIPACVLVPAGLRAQPASSAAGEAVENIGQGTINWTSGEVFATGIGAPPAHPVNPAQARAMAERAALVVALRNLLEVVKGVRVDSETVVENFIVKSDSIRTKVDGIVRGAMPVKKQYLSDGSVEITVGMKMQGAFMDAIIPVSFGSRTDVPLPALKPVPSVAVPQETKQVPPSPLPLKQPQPSPPAPSDRRPEPPKQEPMKPAPSLPQPQQEKKPEPAPPLPVTTTDDKGTLQFRGGKATGIVIDGRGLGLRPALLPRIIDSQGQEIYVGQVVTRTNAVEQGVAGYAKDVHAAANNFRVTDNPAVIKGLRASGATRTDIVLGPDDAQALRELSRKGDFLQYCRVIIVY